MLKTLLPSNDKMQIKHIVPRERVLFWGNGICPSCKRVIPGAVFLRDGYSFSSKYCSYENKAFEALLAKGECGKASFKAPGHWPTINLKEGNYGISDCDVRNLSNIAVATFHVTYQCNAKCKICKYVYLPDCRKEMPLDFIKGKLRFFRKKIVAIFGGEPTTRGDLPGILNAIRHSGNIALLCTNGIKISETGYLALLKRSGLRYLDLSFDGFSEDIYGKLRGETERYQYRLKLKALENLKKEKGIAVSFNTTLVRGINDDQVPLLINYALENNFVNGISFRPLCLQGAEEFAGMTRDNLLSLDEIRSKVSDALGLSPEYFEAWDKAKLAAAAFLKDKCGWLRGPVFLPGKVYLLRRGGKFKPLLELAALKELETALKNKNIRGLLQFKLLGWYGKIALGLLLGKNLEFGILRRSGIFKISVSLLVDAINEVYPSCQPLGDFNYILLRGDAYNFDLNAIT